MGHTTCEISTVCRFCLCQDDLIPVSQATASLLTIEDIVHFTGVEISDEEQQSYAMCYQCHGTLENSIAFRSTCQGNDFVFKQLFSMLIESVKDDLKEHEDMTQAKDDHSDNEYDGQFGAEEELPIERNALATCAFQATRKTIFTPTRETSTYWSDDDKTIQTMTDDESTNSETFSEVISEQSDCGIEKPKRNKPREKELCAICGKIVCNLKDHIKNTHVMEKKYACPHCPAVMRNQANMWKHISAVHKNKIVISCEQCGKGFKHKNSYTSHMMSHHGIGKSYECKICSKTFGQRSSFGTHMKRWHLPSQELACKFCDKTFKLSVSLKNHQRVHSNDKPYACKVCPKRFKSSDAKKKHEITHTGVRFACKLCEKSYSYKTQLSTHYRKDHEVATPADTENENICTPSTTID